MTYEKTRLNAILNACEIRAKAAYGNEVVEAALAEALKVGIADEFVRHLDPYDSLVKWYKDRDATNKLFPLAVKDDPQ